MFLTARAGNSGEAVGRAGGVGAVFGVGAANQTYITSDGGQFKRAVEKYRADPFLFEP